MNQYILRSLFPRMDRLLIVLAIIFFFVGGEALIFARAAFNGFLLTFGIKLAILWHEMGHLVFAKLAGGKPRRMVLGRGHKIYQTEYKGIKILLHEQFNSGFAFAGFDHLQYMRWKLFAFVLGGPMTNFIIGGGLFLAFGFSFRLNEEILWATAIGIANLYIGAYALIPYSFKYHGVKYYTDGYSIFKIPYYTEKELRSLTAVNDWLDGQDLLEERKYDEALELFNRYQDKSVDKESAHINLSIVYIRLEQYDKALQLLTDLLPDLDEEKDKHYRHFIYNNIAWINLILGNLEEADTYSEQAHTLSPDTPNICGTRGATLIENGEFQAGIDLLYDLVDLRFPNANTLLSSIYLALAFQGLDQAENAEPYIQFVHEHEGILEPDERVLYERAKEIWAKS